MINICYPDTHGHFVVYIFFYLPLDYRFFRTKIYKTKTVKIFSYRPYFVKLSRAHKLKVEWIAWIYLRIFFYCFGICLYNNVNKIRLLCLCYINICNEKNKIKRRLCTEKQFFLCLKRFFCNFLIKLFC